MLEFFNVDIYSKQRTLPLHVERLVDLVFTCRTSLLGLGLLRVFLLSGLFILSLFLALISDTRDPFLEGKPLVPEHH